MAPPGLFPAEDAEAAPPLSVSQWLNAPADFGLHALHGRVVVLHAFQMLCPGCVAHAIPQAQRVAATFEPEHVAVVGLHTVFEHHEAMRPVSLAAFLDEYRVAFPVGIDAPGERVPTPLTMARYGMRGTPSLVLLDRQGRMRHHSFGRIDDLVLGAWIAALAQEELVERDAIAGEEAAETPVETVRCSEDACVRPDAPRLRAPP